MINKNSEGIIIYIKIIKDNDLFIRLLSKEDKLISGIVYGGNSSKKKTRYQLGYFIEFLLTQKKNDIPASISGDLIKPYISSIINDQYKSHALLAIISLINASILLIYIYSNLYYYTRINLL